eukprot:TRINITY_DN38933_c0_g1_i1.p1 TRINITY_DN38933_c0_g1~~TRINITY_DN38933_c0_g1_i1.p1  ORF type:complete len:228 (-),score=13.91 TRINITY_DN38933_c0_g1_i1:251-853(-)
MSSQKQTKLQEQATAKDELSYSYWAKNAASYQESDSSPQPLKEQEIQQLETKASSSKSGGSAWNHAGTFEERDYSSWAKDWLKQKLIETKQELDQGYTLQFSKVDKCDGEAHTWFIRGSKRCGFEFQIKFQWEAYSPESKEEMKGNIEIPNVCMDELDELQINIEVSKGQNNPQLNQTKSVIQASLRQIIDEFIQALKEK